MPRNSSNTKPQTLYFSPVFTTSGLPTYVLHVYNAWEEHSDVGEEREDLGREATSISYTVTS